MNKIGILLIISIFLIGCKARNQDNKIKDLSSDSIIVSDYIITSKGIYPDSTLTKNEKTELKNSLDKSQTDSIAELWNLMVFQKNVCLGGEEYVSDKEFKPEPKQLFFSEIKWEKFAENDKTKLTEFLIRKLSDTTTTTVHTCPFFEATNGEMAVYSLQHIHNKNWFDFMEFKEYKDKEILSATDQPQVWLQNLLKNEAERKILSELYRNNLKK